MVETTKATRDALVKEFGEQTHGIAYAYTSGLLQFCLTRKEHPHKEFSKLEDLRAQVKAAGVNIDKYIVCILLIWEFPEKYEAIAQSTLLETDKDKLKLELLRNKCNTDQTERCEPLIPATAETTQSACQQHLQLVWSYPEPVFLQQSTATSNANQQQTGQSCKNSKHGGKQVKSRKANAIAQQAHAVAFSSISDIPSIPISEYFENCDNVILPLLSVPCPTPPPPQTKHTIFGVNKDRATQGTILILNWISLVLDVRNTS
ncbi:hypothetical protein NMY22_g15041 [Coprinellus aureogranulatus]|nr:hypothetical protein NMY22_g15041 [Coprinellus aureogranulatus]